MAPGVGEFDGEGAAAPPVAGPVARWDSARRTGPAPPRAGSEAVPDAGVTGRTGARDPDSGCGTARCTGAPAVESFGEPVRRSPAEAGRSGRAVARWPPGVSLPAGGGVPPSVRRTARCTGGVGAAAPLPIGALDAGPLPAAPAGGGLDGCAAARWTGGVPDGESLLAGAGGVGPLPPDGRAVGVVPMSGAVDAGLPPPCGAGARRTGSAAVPLSAGAAAGLPLPGWAGEPDGRVAARWTGGVPGAVPLLAGAGAGGLLVPVGRVVARWTGVVLSPGAVAAGVPPPDCRVPRPAGASAGVGPDGRTVARWTGGVSDPVPLFAGAGGVGLLPLDGRAVVRWTGGVPGAEPRLAGAGSVGLPAPDGRVAARWTGGVPGAVPRVPGAGAGGLLVPVGRAVVRWTGAPLSPGAVAAGVPPPGCRVPRPAGASAGAGPDGRVAVRWTGGVPDPAPLFAGAGAGVAGAPPSGRRTGDAGAVALPGAGVVPGADTARCTGAPVGAGAGVPEPRAGEAPPAGAEPGSARSASADEGAVPEEAVPEEAVPEEAVPEEAVPDDAVPDDAVPDGAGAVPVVRRLAGNARRCTAGDPDGALVSDCRGSGAAGGAGTGVTRTPREAGAGVLAGTAGDAVPAERARWTGAATDVADGVAAVGAGPGAADTPGLPGVPDAPPRALGAAPVGAVGAAAGDGASAGIARSGATGIRCTGGAPAGRARGVGEA
ncbi:hypothetical protein AB0C68_11270 [Streptomyces tendae]|uniref:hypothetical protein n=1 Tax=Streptomyces tendae TaxID=1932 RepID=UPI0033D3BBE4